MGVTQERNDLHQRIVVGDSTHRIALPAPQERVGLRPIDLDVPRADGHDLAVPGELTDLGSKQDGVAIPEAQLLGIFRTDQHRVAGCAHQRVARSINHAVELLPPAGAQQEPSIG